MEFEWDESKAAANLSKHGVSFDEAHSVFNDPLYVDFYAPEHARSEKFMKKVETEAEDELRPEYDLRSLQVRKVGAGRKSFGGAMIRLEPDVAKVFPDSEAVNEALRFLIRITKENRSSLARSGGDV